MQKPDSLNTLSEMSSLHARIGPRVFLVLTLFLMYTMNFDSLFENETLSSCVNNLWKVLDLMEFYGEHISINHVHFGFCLRMFVMLYVLDMLAITSLPLVRHIEAVPRTPWLGYSIQPVSGPLTPCTEGKTPVDAPFRAVKPRIGNRCTASGDLCIRISGINRVLFSYCFRQFLRFRSDTHCFDCWRWDRDFTVTASLTVYNGNFNAIRHEGSKAFRNCMDASAIFTSYTRNLNPNFSGCRNRIFDFDIPALDLTSFEWTYVLPYARINFPFILPSI